jgi:hypothetical protein
MTDFICVLGRTKPALLSSKEYSISSGVSTGLTAGVIAVCIGTDTVEGVMGIGIGIAFGVLLFSSSAMIFVFEGVLKDRSFIGGVFLKVSLCGVVASSKMLDFDETVEEIGEKGCRSIGDCGSRAFTAPNECFFVARPAISNPLLPAK